MESSTSGKNGDKIEIKNKQSSGTSNGCVIDNDIYFPRCEFKARFKETSIFKMDEPKYWARYFRAEGTDEITDRLAHKPINKTFQNVMTNNKDNFSAMKAGSFNSPFKNDEYKKIFDKTDGFHRAYNRDCKGFSEKDGTILYDHLLEYKLSMCKLVVDDFKNEGKKIKAYCENDYPCIIVQLLECPVEKGLSGDLYKIIFAYFIAITNYVARNSNVPIELVNRASFGQNISCVSVLTPTSFRISVGIVPKVYAKEVLVKSLQLLDSNFLVPLLDKKPEFRSDFDLFDVLNQPTSITEKREYIDLIADFVFEQLLNNDERSDLDEPFVKMLKFITSESNDPDVIDEKMKNIQNYDPMIGGDEENPEIDEDERFWEIVGRVSSAYESANITTLAGAIRDKKIRGLYAKLERANLEFIEKSGDGGIEDGYGSASDCECELEFDDDDDESGKCKLYSKKIILATGMRALNIAQFVSLWDTGLRDDGAYDKIFDTTNTYYETVDVIHDQVVNIYNSVRNELEGRETAERVESSSVKWIDLNHNTANSSDKKVDLKRIQDELNEEHQIVILDYTSATTAKISEAIRLFMRKVSTILLFNSGLKNEQIGADINPYGTLRVVSKDVEKVNLLCYGILLLIKDEAIPKESHRMRKAYKSVGAVVTSGSIFTKKRGYKGHVFNADTMPYDEWVDVVANEFKLSLSDVCEKLRIAKEENVEKLYWLIVYCSFNASMPIGVHREELGVGWRAASTILKDSSKRKKSNVNSSINLCH